MRPIFAYALTMAVLPLAFSWLAAQSPAAAPRNDAPSLREIAAWIEQLGSAKFAEREAATRKLVSLDEVPEALEKARISPDLEVSHRANRIVEQINERNLDRRIQEALAPINAIGLDLFVELMVRRAGYALLAEGLPPGEMQESVASGEDSSKGKISGDSRLRLKLPA